MAISNYFWLAMTKVKWETAYSILKCIMLWDFGKMKKASTCWSQGLGYLAQARARITNSPAWAQKLLLVEAGVQDPPASPMPSPNASSRPGARLTSSYQVPARTQAWGNSPASTTCPQYGLGQCPRTLFASFFSKMRKILPTFRDCHEDKV